MLPTYTKTHTNFCRARERLDGTVDIVGIVHSSHCWHCWRRRAQHGSSVATVAPSGSVERKIITVDEASIAQAVAVRGDRIVAVGSNSEIVALAGASTRRIDLRGRAVIPGLIDNHMHLLRAGATWKWEVRWDGIGSRKAALDMLSARAKAVNRDDWVYNLGGWTIDQFSADKVDTNDKRPFTREELDRAVPDNPVLLQSSLRDLFNSRAAGAGILSRMKDARLGGA